MEIEIFVGGRLVHVNVDRLDWQAWLTRAFARWVRRKAALMLRAGLSMDVLNVTLDEAIEHLNIDDLKSAAYDDEVETEALSLAEADIVAELARDGLPPPRMLREHAQALIAAQPEYNERARQRLMARAEVVHETLAIADAEL